MSSWICDGVPKDGKDYPGLGGKHEPFNNELSDCEYCGLPQEAMMAESGSGSVTELIGGKGMNLGTILAAIVTCVLLLAGGSIAYFSGIFSSGDRYLNTYQDAVGTGDEALAIIQSHENPEQLAQAQEYLSEAMTKLSKIPQKADIYPEAEAKINNYDTLSTQITSKLSSGEFQLCADPQPKTCLF
ncbi:MAG: hypothetical protein HC930_10825 [Hydrococcus sp. SU_1_0]|nr:hypothetical protein [Hydrococcus sp. SU_1_0]